MRRYVTRIEKAKARLKTEIGDAVLAVARLQASYERRIEQLNKDMLAAKPGTKTRLDYLRALGREEREHAQLLMDFGVYPKSLGVTVIDKYEFKSHVGLGGSTKAVRMPLLEAEFPDSESAEGAWTDKDSKE